MKPSLVAFSRGLIALIALLPLVGGQTAVGVTRRLDCYSERDASQTSCEQRGCVWAPSVAFENIPFCFFPPNVGYRTSDTGEKLKLQKQWGQTGTPYGTDIAELKLDVERLGTTMRIRITTDTPRFEVPIHLPRTPTSIGENLNFEVKSQSEFASFKVVRPSTGATLFDTSIGGLIFSDQFIQIAGIIPSDKLYGLGENTHHDLKHNLSRYSYWSMWSRDRPPGYGPREENLYGVFPFYMVLEKDGKASGFLLLNSNAMDAFTGPAPFVGFRTIGGMLDMYFFPGPSPEQVVKQYLSIVGRPMMPAYWALGFQLCRYGYKNLKEVQETVNRTLNAGIPLDVQYVDIDYMDRFKDFTIDQANFAALPKYADELHSLGMKLTLIFDPAIDATDPSFRRGRDKNVFIQWPRDTCVQKDVNDQYEFSRGSDVMLGVVWPDNNAGFPDFFRENTTEWWIDEFKRFHDIVKFDGAWIDMNEPANFATNGVGGFPQGHPDTPKLFCNVDCLTKEERALELPPFTTLQGDLRHSTLCMSAKNGDTTHYNLHSLYGFAEAIATEKAIQTVTGTRGFVISRSLFPGAGRYTGHWTGDNTSKYSHMKMSIINVIEWNMFGVPYAGSDICGFIDDVDEELCLRWQQVGAFHPFSRNHNGLGYKPQDPAVFESGAVARSTQNALNFRYKYLSTLYTLHFKASLEGGTVIRAVFMNYPEDPETHSIQNQFMWGDLMMISPVLEPEHYWVKPYFPNDIWYSIYAHEYAKIRPPGRHTMQAPWTTIPPVHIRGGAIMTGQASGRNTVVTRKLPFELLVATDANGSASGDLYWDDGEQIIHLDEPTAVNHYEINFAYNSSADSGKVTITMNRRGRNIALPKLKFIEVLGHSFVPDFSSFKLYVGWEGLEQTLATDSRLSMYDANRNRLYVAFVDGIDMDEHADVIPISWKKK